eukprot:5146556-Lingulodinium_polyedra.AAC.1
MAWRAKEMLRTHKRVWLQEASSVCLFSTTRIAAKFFVSSAIRSGFRHASTLRRPLARVFSLVSVLRVYGSGMSWRAT